MRAKRTWLVLALAILAALAVGGLVASRGEADEQQLEEVKDGEVTQQGETDHPGEAEPVPPESVTKVGDNITIVSNTMTPPPGGWAFKEFPSPNPWHFVDIETDPEAPPGSADTDTGSAIKISVEGVPETAGAWPLKGEGNLTPPPGGQGTAEFHWSAKAYKIFPILYKDNTTWTEEARLTSDPVHLFTMDVIAGVEILSAPGKTVKAKMWTGDDTENKVTITLTETGAGTGVYRNTGTDTWPHFYRIYDAANKRLKVVDEDKKWYVVPIVDNKEYSGLEVSEKVDAAEVAVVDATPSDDAKQFWDCMTDGAPPGTMWADAGKRIWSVPADRPHVTDDTCVDFGSKADMLYIAGHGLASTAAIWGSQNDDPDHPLGIYQDPATVDKAFTPGDIGGSWDNGEIEWCLLAVCSQVAVSDPPVNGDLGIQWIKAMPKVHALFGYRDTAPSGGVDVDIADDFCERLAPGGNYDSVQLAWMFANRPDEKTVPGLFATALVNENNMEDHMYTLDRFPAADNPGSEYRYWWIEKVGWWDPVYELRLRYVTLP